MTVLITLTTAAVDATTFDLYSDVDGFAVPFETNVPVASLTTGYTSSLVPNGTVTIRVQNVSVACSNSIDLILVTTTTTTSSTTTTTTTVATVQCNATTNSGGVGVTEFTFDLVSYGGVLIMDFNAQGVPDKLEILHNGVRVATSGMTGTNAGPFDTLYGDPTVPTSGEAASTTQFIGTSKGAIPNRNAEFLSDTGVPGIIANRQQLIWFSYTNTEYLVNPQAVVRVTGPSGTAWSLDRQCQPDIALTDVIFNTADNPTDVWQYSPSTMLEVFLFNSGVASSDIAHTENKLWVYNVAATELIEYDITLQPFTYAIARTITNVYTNAGLCAVNDVTLVNIDGVDVYTLDITNPAAVPTLEFTMPNASRFVAGDYVYTTGGKLIVTRNEVGTIYVEQYDYDLGILEFELDITATIPFPYGVYQYNAEVFIVNQAGQVYNILTASPYTLSLVDTLSFTVNGASQVPSQITEEFVSNTTTTTTTPTPTTTTTTTAASLPSAELSSSSVAPDCGLILTAGWFIDKAGSVIANGDIIYDDDAGVGATEGNGDFYRINDVDGATIVTATISVSGVVGSVSVCP